MMKRMSYLIAAASLTSILFLGGCTGTQTEEGASWQTARVTTAPAKGAEVGADGSGTVFSVWGQATGFYASRYIPDSGWERPQKISEPRMTSGPRESPQTLPGMSLPRGSGKSMSGWVNSILMPIDG